MPVIVIFSLHPTGTPEEYGESSRNIVWCRQWQFQRLGEQELSNISFHTADLSCME